MNIKDKLLSHNILRKFREINIMRFLKRQEKELE